MNINDISEQYKFSDAEKQLIKRLQPKFNIKEK